MRSDLVDIYCNLDDIQIDQFEIRPTDWVVLKPNLVKEGRENNLDDWECVITSPALVRVVARKAAARLKAGEGRITICDAPQTDSSFKKISERMGFSALSHEIFSEFGVQCDIVDLRNEEWVNDSGIIVIVVEDFRPVS